MIVTIDRVSAKGFTLLSVFTSFHAFFISFSSFEGFGNVSLEARSAQYMLAAAKTSSLLNSS